MSEDILARLKAAEDEAKRLREELATAQAGKPEAVPTERDVIAGKPSRFDGQTSRETMAFKEGGAARSSWLTESDVAFFTGGSPTEGETATPEDEEAKGMVTKRLALGILASLGLAALSFIPTGQMQIKPSRPLYTFIVPLLRVQGLLGGDALKEVVQAGEWDRLRSVLSRVVGPPNDVRGNLDAIISLLQNDSATANKVEAVGLELVGFISQCDYQNYFDAIPVRTLSSAQNLQFVDYSSRALVAAQGKLRELLALMPAEALSLARDAARVGFEE